MEPNNINTQNTPGAMQGVTANTGTVAQTAPVAPVEPVAPAPPMEPTVNPVAPAAVPNEQKAEDKKKKKNSWVLLVLILCIIIALAGVGYGIWATVDGNARVDRLSAENNSLQSQNTELTEKVTELSTAIDVLTQSEHEPEERVQWASTEVKDGVFYVLGTSGQVIAQSSADGPTVNDVILCESSKDETILKCTVNTSEGEGRFLYDVFDADSLVFKTEAEY